MVENTSNRRVAIACQGGGSHTAFAAGVLKRLLEAKNEGRHNYEVVALSGTSGGSICALLAWYGLLMDDADKAGDLLDSFWRDNSANSPWDRLLNDWLLQTNRFLANVGGSPTVSPYFYLSWGQDRLKSMLEEHVDFERLEELVKSSSPMLLIGAVDVLSGEFKAFSSRRDRINVDVILASAALPTLFKAVHINGGVYWDGLLSQNPPVRELPDARPEEIWVIQIDPQKDKFEPKTMPKIMDRRNELSGNLSLNQEIFFIEKINEWVAKGFLSGTKHEVIEVKWIQMLRDLDAESKLNRDPEFIQGLISYGEEQAQEFLVREFAGVGRRAG
ncbi:MAG: patatin-like phospholipase family protein [Actinobacteria bacterium]|nr:patatin-like phospholipase family protein [Actinomycetota bacterium]